MSQQPDRVAELRQRLVDIGYLVERLGLQEQARREGGGWKVLCPFHGERSPSCSITLGPDGTVRVRCFSCEASGDVFHLIAAAKQMSCERDFPAVLDLAAELAGAAPPSAPARRPAHRSRPPAGEVLSLWGACLSPGPEDPELAGRGLDPAQLAERDLVRVLPAGEMPRWAQFRRSSWLQTGHRYVLLMYGARGEVESIHARALAKGVPEPKALSPAGCLLGGLVFADVAGRDLLRTGRAPPGGVVICEGVPDFLTVAALWGDADEQAPAVLGVISGSWGKEIGTRIPDGTKVVIWTHSDAGGAGQRYAAAIAGTLAGRCRVHQVNQEVLAEEKKAPDINDTLRGGGREAVLSVIEGAEPLGGSAHPCTDLGNAERLQAGHGAELRFVHPWNKWLVWDGRRWSRDESGEVQRRTARAVRAILREAEAIEDKEERKRVVRWSFKSEAASRLEAAQRLARSLAGIPVAPGELDQDPWALNVENGILDLRTGLLQPHRAQALHTKLAPVSYRPDAACPLWLALVHRAMGGQQELADFLQRSFGYALTGSVREQVLFFFYGLGANGKSTILETILGLLGDYATQAAPDLLLDRPGEPHPTEQADLFGARAVACQEAKKGRRWDEALLKRLTGGDTLKVRRMREDFWEFCPSHKLFVSANHRPQVRGTDNAIWRRILLVPFLVTIPEGERDKDLPEKLRKEWPGILRWALEGCLIWQRSGLLPPSQVRAATDAYRQEQDLLGPFLQEVCVLHDAARVSRAELRRAYEAWCRDSGEDPVSPRHLAEILREHGVTDGKVRHPETRLPVDGWRGIRLKSEQDQVPPDDPTPPLPGLA